MDMYIHVHTQPAHTQQAHSVATTGELAQTNSSVYSWLRALSILWGELNKQWPTDEPSLRMTASIHSEESPMI